MPKGKKHTPEQIVAILRRIDGGLSAQAVSREVNISEATLHRWKQLYGAMEIDELKELKRPGGRERPLEADRRRPGPEHPGAERGELKKMVSSPQKRHAAQVW